MNTFSHLTKYITLIFLVLGLNCENRRTNSIPENLSGYQLAGQVTSGDSTFKEMVGYEFKTLFTSENEFKTYNKEDQVESFGSYQYSKTKDNRATLILNTAGKSGKMQISLTFTNTRSGVYEAILLEGEKGLQNGLFDLK